MKKPIVTHPFQPKSSRAKKNRKGCRECGHLLRHRIHRHIYPAGSVERMAQDESGRIAGEIARHLMKPSPFVAALESGKFPTGLGSTIVERMDYVVTPCPKCGEPRKSLPSFNEPMECHKCRNWFMPNPCGELCHIKQTPSGPVLMRGKEEVANVVMSPEVSQKLSEAAHEEASTGAVRSSLYPKGSKFPARYDLMWRNAAGMRRLAETWGEGFAKYGADNWFKGFAESVLISHTLEHIRLYLAGDKEEDHLSNASWNLLALAWIEENKPELLDLTKPEQKP